MPTHINEPSSRIRSPVCVKSGGFTPGRPAPVGVQTLGQTSLNRRPYVQTPPSRPSQPGLLVLGRRRLETRLQRGLDLRNRSGFQRRSGRGRAAGATDDPHGIRPVLSRPVQISRRRGSFQYGNPGFTLPGRFLEDARPPGRLNDPAGPRRRIYQLNALRSRKFSKDGK